MTRVVSSSIGRESRRSNVRRALSAMTEDAITDEVASSGSHHGPPLALRPGCLAAL